MSFFKKTGSRTIKAQIVIAFATLTVLIVSLEALAHVWIRQMLAITSVKERIAHIREVQMQMKSASNEFILREKTHEQFFATGKSLYLDRYRYYMRELRENIREVRNDVTSLNAIDETEVARLETTVGRYNDVFLQMAEKMKTRGFGNYGLIGEFGKSIRDLLQYDFGTDKTAVANLQLFVKDYLLTGDPTMIGNISNEIFNFTMVLESHIEDEEVQKVAGILTAYETVFKELTKVDSAIGIYTQGGMQGRLFSVMDDLDTAIQLEKTNAKVNAVYSNNVFRLYLSFFLVVGTAVLAAYIINRRLYKSLVVPMREMKSMIARMSRGEVPQTGLGFRTDDLNEMAKALNNLVTGIKNYQDFANSIGKGDFETPFTPLSQQDILGSSLLAMRNSLKAGADADKKRAWAAQGLAEINLLLRKQVKTETELYNNALQFIVKYTGSNQGSLFLLADETDSRYLELVACYAWEKRKFLQKRIELGDGLTGQCALEQEAIYITRLPENYVRITSGLGGATPHVLLITPLKTDGRMVGVLEIASFKSFEPYQIDLVGKLAESVAATIHAGNVKVTGGVVAQL